MYIRKRVPDAEQNIDDVKRYKALLDEEKPLPYKELMEKLIKKSGLTTSKMDEASKAAFRLFGDYLEENKIIYPTKVDAIDFIYQNKDELDCFQLNLLFSTATWVVNYCSNNFQAIFGGLFAGATIVRSIVMNHKSIIDEDTVSYEIVTPKEDK